MAMTMTNTAEARPATPAFRTDEEFEQLCPPLTSDEHAMLTSSILAHGVREPLVVWKEERILLDGHTRLAICKRHYLPYPVAEYSLQDRAAARAFVIDNALARRNLTEEQRRYLRGKRLLAEKKDKTENLREGELPKHQGDASGKTASRIAKREGVSQATVERDARFAADVDAVATTAGPDAKAAILAGSAKATRAQVRRVAAQRPTSLADFRRLVESPRSAAPTAEKPARDRVAEIGALAKRTAAALRAYARADARRGDRERLTELWALRSEIERLFTHLEGDTPCN